MATEEQTVQILNKTLREHGVRAKFATTYTGPTVTQYAYTLESGTRLRQVNALAEDLALAVGLPDIRVQAPIPGTSLVGLEVPRDDRETVTYSDFTMPVTEGEEDVIEDMALPFPIGVNIASQPIWADLTKLPHLLIAGATGSGKSVALSSMLTYLIENNTPDELRMWLIDPKRVELSAFSDAPQVERTATEMSEAIDLLTDVEGEMDRRYTLFEDAGVKNIKEYNDEQTLDDQKLPYHVVAIDEMADLIMKHGKVVEPVIVRIAQLARAAGIHMVLATQRPTVNVVTGLIKNNVPSRWAFSVQANKDSMVILDQPGAEKLFGAGDSLWLAAGSQDAMRVQSVWTDEAEVEKIVEEAEAAYGDVPTTTGSDAHDDEDDDVALEDMGIPLDGPRVEAEKPADDVWFPVDPASFEKFEEFKESDVSEYVEYVDTIAATLAANTPTLKGEQASRKELIQEVMIAMEEEKDDRKVAKKVRRSHVWSVVWKTALVVSVCIVALATIIGAA